MTLEELKREAGLLPITDRGELVSALIATLGEPAHHVSDEEVIRRVEETRNGDVEDISHEDLLGRLKHVWRQ